MRKMLAKSAGVLTVFVVLAGPAESEAITSTSGTVLSAALTSTELDVYDATANERLALKVLNRKSWNKTNQYEFISLPFYMDGSRTGHAIELRVYSYAQAQISVDRIGVR